MHDDEDRIHGERDRGDRARHDSRPFGSSRRPRSGGIGGGLFDSLGNGAGNSLFDRIMRDVSSWFDDDDDERGARRHGGDHEDTFGRRAPGPRARRDARPAEHDGDFDDGGASARRDASGPGDHVGGARPDDDYADEDGTSRSLRGRGPRNYRRSDERITELVNDALQDDDALDASDVEVSVEGGDVTLSGSVPSRRQKHRAENVAVRVSGVHDVDNRLRVKRETASGGEHGAPGGTPGEQRRDADDYGHPS